MSTQTVTGRPDQDVLTGWGAQFLNAMLDSADPDALGRNYWDRARSALEAGAATASFGEAVSKTAAKLEIHGALTPGAVTVIAALGQQLGDAAVFGAWAELCRRDAVYVTALARIQRDERKEAAKAARQQRPAAAPDDTEEPRF